MEERGLKPVIWIGSSLDDVRNLPDDVRRRVGFELQAIQRGETPSDVKPMNIVGKGTQEIRIQIGDAYRVFFVARFEEAVYVLHAFQKKSQQTARRDISLGQQRYLHMVHYRKEQQGKPE